ncbi:MAG: hemerythrin domain-containing protein [Deltaproteobacteria bacterium]|nr:hemerythrin domain-containing protein [Deltaproteobacteria bacterium]
MKPIGPLMREHRLIEKMLTVLEKAVDGINKSGKVDPALIDRAVDFIRTYADRTHHGKEEDILFRDLAKKPLTTEQARIMGELVEEHRYARATVGRLIEAKTRYVQGEPALPEIAACLTELAAFYPRHIEKEDRHFFFPIQDYFSAAEQEAMLREFEAFDGQMIHEKYRKVVEEASGTTLSGP